MLWVYDRYKYFNSFSAGIDCICQNLTSTDVFIRQILTYKDSPCAERVKTNNMPNVLFITCIFTLLLLHVLQVIDLYYYYYYSAINY